LPSNKTIAVTTVALAIRTLAGPNVFVPFAAVVAQFTIPKAIARDGTLPEEISVRLPEALIAQIQALHWSAPFEKLVARLAQALQDWHGANDLPCHTSRMPSGLGRVYLGYHDERVASYALQLGYELALAASPRDQETIETHSALAAKLVQLGVLTEHFQPDEVDRAMIRAARARAIPFYRVVPDGRIFQYGQGKHGRHFVSTSSQLDSYTGFRLQHNKVISNSLVRRLGFPGVDHGVVDTADNALRLARRMGYPLVIKPADGRQGQGVTVGVTSEEEVDPAFAQANTVSPGRVLVERLVEGEDVRLYVLCGRFGYAVSRSPPRIVGDGKHSVMELIDFENRLRPPEGFPKKLKVDPAMVAVLQKQNLRLDDAVPAGQIVTLRSVPNASTGGTFVVITDRVHADNQRMAEAIARCFRLETIGIDFMTPDVAKSWREVRCAVIEVNSAPTILSAAPTGLQLERTFFGAFTGRIPSIIFLSNEVARASEIVRVLEREGLIVGFVDRASGSLGGEPRAIEHARLAERLHGLLLDPTCEALVVGCTPDELLKQGLPLDRFDLCVIDSNVTLWPQLRGLLEQHSGRVLDNFPTDAVLIGWLKDVVRPVA
jgi:D-alanine-D-alanine ligase-like ATP-grasp enzyme